MTGGEMSWPMTGVKNLNAPVPAAGVSTRTVKRSPARQLVVEQLAVTVKLAGAPAILRLANSCEQVIQFCGAVPVGHANAHCSTEPNLAPSRAAWLNAVVT